MSTIVPVVFAFDDRVLRPAAVAIRSLVDSALPKTCYEIHILHPGFHARAADGFRSLVASTRHRILLHRVRDERIGDLPCGKGSWTSIVYQRFLIPEVLASHERVIYSDVDVYFRDDLSSLMQLDMQECPIGAVIGEENGPDMRCHTFFPENTSSYVFMSGFLLMDLDRMRAEDVSGGVFRAAKRFGSRLKMYDLDALNLAGTRMHPLSFRYCVLESVYAADDPTDADEYSWLSRVYSRSDLEEARSDPAVIHYAGKLGKPWRRSHVPAYYRDALARVPAVLNRWTLRDRRKLLVSVVKSLVRERVG
jgi:lipopolysaccharide biosynthesis glycosyltransferase